MSKDVKKVEVDLIADTVKISGEFVHKKDTPSVTVPTWLANSLVTQGVAKNKGAK